MKQYRAYLIDLDGTIYRGKERIPSAEQWVHALQKQAIPYLFVTNNATSSPEQVVKRLKTYYDIETDVSSVMTSGVATVSYLQKHFPAKELYVVGEEALKTQLQKAGYVVDSSDPEVVVQSVDRNVTYAQLEKATLAIRNGATFITTNVDTNIPTERGLVPGSGSITAFLKTATQVEPIVIGKPSPIIMEHALELLNRTHGEQQPFVKDELVMVGDNYNTDIKAGMEFGIDTLMVLTGVSKRDDIKDQVQPTYVVDQLAGWHL